MKKTPWGEPYNNVYFTSFEVWQTPQGVPIIGDYAGPAIKRSVRLSVPTSQFRYYKTIHDLAAHGSIPELSRLTAEILMYKGGHPVVA